MFEVYAGGRDRELVFVPFGVMTLLEHNPHFFLTSFGEVGVLIRCDFGLPSI